MLSNSTNHNLTMPLAVVADSSSGPSGGGGVPRVITVNSPTNENANMNKEGQSLPPLPSVAEPTPKVRNGGAIGGKTTVVAPISSSNEGGNRSLTSASSGTTASSSSSRAHNSLVEASDDVDSKSRASSTSFPVPHGREGARAGTASDTKVKSIDTRASSSIPNSKPNGVSARPPRPIPTEQRRHQRQQMVSQSIAFQHGEDATTLCSSVADDSRNDHSSLGGSASAFSGGSERDSMTNSVGFSYEEDEDGHDDRTDDGYEGLAGNAPIYDCGLFGIDEQAEDDFEKFYDDLSIDSQGRDGLDRERAARHKEKMKQMALALRKRTRGRKGHKNKNSAASLGTGGGSVITAVAQDICSPKVAKARIEMAYENYLHTYKFDTVKTPTASNKAHNNAELESRRIDRRTKRSKLSNKKLVTNADGDVAVATSTVPPFQGSVEMDSSAGSSHGSDVGPLVCPMCSSKLLHQHRRVFLDVLPTVPHDAHVATAATVTARATNPRGHDNVPSKKFMGATSKNCLQCADKCPGSVQPTVKNFLQHIFASSSTEHRDDDVTDAKGSLVHQQNVEKDPYRDENNCKNTSDADYEERPVPPYCAECRIYIVAEATEAELREEMLANLSEWIVDTNNDEEDEDEEDIEFKVASLQSYEDGTIVVERPLRGNILVFLDEEEGDKMFSSSNLDMDEQSVTTRQQENLTPAPVPTLPTYPGLHLVSSGEVQARGREVLPPPPALLPSISEDPEDPHAKRADVDVSPMFASQFGPPDASVPFSDALNNTAWPNKEADIAEIPGNNVIAEASSIDQTPSIRTEDEQAEMIASYPTKRDIATNIIGSKLVNGYTLTHKQCSVCDMPMMDRDGRCKCVVCPVIKRKAKKIAKDKRKERKKIGPAVTNAISSVEAVNVPIDNKDDQIYVSQGGEGAQSGILARNLPVYADVSKVVQGDKLLQLVEAPVRTYFDGFDVTADRLLNGWHLSDERQGCSSCGHPMICEEDALCRSAGESNGVCINNSCRMDNTKHLNHSQDRNFQSNRSYDSDDDDLFDLDDPALVALQKLACDKKNAETTSTDNRKSPHDNAGNTSDENDSEMMERTRQSSRADSLAVSNKDEGRQSFEHFTFDRQGFDNCRFDANSTEPKSVSSPGAEIHCDSLSSCSSLSFSAKKSHCSKKTCATGIATSRSESSDGSDDMSALVEKMNRAKQRILSRVERRGVGPNNRKGRADSKSRNDVDYDVANLIDRLAIAAKEVEELDNCIAKAQEDQALDF